MHLMKRIAGLFFISMTILSCIGGCDGGDDASLVTTITSKPANPSTQTSATFTFEANKTGCSFQCQLDGGEWSSCTSPKTYNDLSSASHTFSVRAIDTAGNAEITPPSYTWIIAIINPITIITSNPAVLSFPSWATFTFEANETGCTFQCQLDGGPWVSCTSPQIYNSLSSGSHTFSVRAVDPEGNIEPNPQSYTWVVASTNNPVTTIIDMPKNPTGETSVTFNFSANKTDSRFECQLDGGEWTDCSSPQTYTRLSDGNHTFSVRAIDSAGNVEMNPPAYAWVIDTIFPITTILTKPESRTTDSSATFTFEVNKPGCTFECKLDSSDWIPCSSPMDYLGLALGTHTFAVRATDLAGNIEKRPPSYIWVIFIHWAPTKIPENNGVPSSSICYTAVWTGSEMIVWGGFNGDTIEFYNTGSSYNPVTDSWNNTSTVNAPLARYCHTTVWTGGEMIVWGGYNGSDYLNTGGRYNPTSNSWAATSIANAPEARYLHTAVWTGSEMIVWGGYNGSDYLNAGGRYNPSADSWTATSTINVPTARDNHTSVWTGGEMIVWGGYNGSDYLNTGGRYNPASNSWTATSIANAPEARYLHTAVWTGTNIIIWGGKSGTTFFNNGAKYDPSANSWALTSATGAPSIRSCHSAVWTGSKMIIWGGDDGTNNFNTGGSYAPSTDSWTATSTNNAPSPRFLHTAIWTGTEMIVWGGLGWGNGLNTGGRYNPTTNLWIQTSTALYSLQRTQHTAVWTGSEMIVWGGYYSKYPKIYPNYGGRYNPSTDSWTWTSAYQAPSGRYQHTAVWTGNEMIVWGGYISTSPYYTNTGGRYNPSTDSWTATSIIGAPSSRYAHTAIWTGTQMIIWGGLSAYLYRSGGRYNPTSNSWTATSIANAPEARYLHTAVWTGSEMIVWGGQGALPTYKNDGSRYNPGTNAWTAVSTSNSPSARDFHTAIWTGTEMIVWGGYYGSYLNTGGKYYPSTDSWTETSLTNVPAARRYHTAVWTGLEMIMWGGYDGSYLNIGGIYNPSTDSWAETSLLHAPYWREYHTAVWTGNEMIIWGGNNNTEFFSTGGRYTP